MLAPFATTSRLTPIQQMSLAVLSRAACASMSTTTTTTRDRGDRYSPMEWAQFDVADSMKLIHTGRAAVRRGPCSAAWRRMEPRGNTACGVLQCNAYGNASCVNASTCGAARNRIV